MARLRFSTWFLKEQTPFDKLFGLFRELLTHTSGDVDEALDWLKELDQEYKLTTPDYTLDDFVDELKQRGFLREVVDEAGAEPGLAITAATERLLRKDALDQIFGQLKKGTGGSHKTPWSGRGDEHTGDVRPYQFGDAPDAISMTESLRNAHVNHGELKLTESDLVVDDTHRMARMATVLMIDISHSMVLYGEDRITPAKKVAMALAELITTRYPKDSLDILVFGNEAWPITIAELPYLKVGPYHTNTVAGLELALDMLRKRKDANKQIFMITDGKPSCLTERDGTFYKNSVGLDDYIVGRCYNMAAQARRLGVPITTFMIASDPYLQQFVQHFTAANQGKAFYTGLKNLGELIFEDYETNRKKRIR